MRAFFSSGDVGGARAILPVIEKCLENGLEIIVLDHGHISKEMPSHWERIKPDKMNSQILAKNFCYEFNIRTFIFSSSLKDPTPLTLARNLKELHVPVIHVLDNWTSYRSRMETDGLSAFRPDYYAVMDDIAYEEAKAEGIEESTLITTGHPALSSLPNEYQKWKREHSRDFIKQYGFDPQKKLVTFVSEPVEQDQGASCEISTYRGYTEKVVLRNLCEAIQQFSESIQVLLLPHPREETRGLKNIWNECKGRIQGNVILFEKGRDGIFLSDGIAGMASLLLYEAWLLGKSVISLQPGVRQKSLRMLQKRENLVFVDSYSEIRFSITHWLNGILMGISYPVRPEMKDHENAPSTIFNLIREQISLNSGRNCFKGEI